MPLIESVISSIAASVFDKAVGVGKDAAKEIKENYSEVEPVQRVIAASNAYVDNYLNRHCQIKILPRPMKEPLDLESIYLSVVLSPEKNHCIASEID